MIIMCKWSWPGDTKLRHNQRWPPPKRHSTDTAGETARRRESESPSTESAIWSTLCPLRRRPAEQPGQTSRGQTLGPPQMEPDGSLHWWRPFVLCPADSCDPCREPAPMPPPVPGMPAGDSSPWWLSRAPHFPKLARKWISACVKRAETLSGQRRRNGGHRPESSPWWRQIWRASGPCRTT